MLSYYVQLHARLFGSIRALLNAYFMGSIFVLHNNGSDVCASSECCVFAQALLSCPCLHILSY